MIDSDSVEVFLPNPDECYERLRRARFGATESCVYCGESDQAIKKRTTGKGAQQYRCKECETYFNDFTGSLFEHRNFPIEGMFYVIKEMRTVPTAQIASDPERDYEAVLNFRHDLQELCGELDELKLSEVCEADEIYADSGVQVEGASGFGQAEYAFVTFQAEMVHNHRVYHNGPVDVYKHTKDG